VAWCVECDMHMAYEVRLGGVSGLMIMPRSRFLNNACFCSMQVDQFDDELLGQLLEGLSGEVRLLAFASSAFSMYMSSMIAKRSRVTPMMASWNTGR
jgi:hypothetical protein